MFKHEQTAEEYHDQQRSMRASGLIQAIWQSGKMPIYDAQDSVSAEKLQMLWLAKMFNESVQIIEEYVKREPYKAPPAPERHDPAQNIDRDQKPTNNWPRPQSRATDNGKKFAFASEKQANRAYAIWKSAGWDDQDAKTFLFDRYGISNPKRIPTELYEEVCKTLNDGPQ